MPVERYRTPKCLDSARPDEWHAGPPACTDSREHVLSFAWRQIGGISHCHNIQFDSILPRRQCQRPIRPAWRIRRSRHRPSMHFSRVFPYYHIGTIHADGLAELAEHLLQPCRGFSKRAIDQPSSSSGL